MGHAQRDKRTICVVTGSRADYGHIFSLMEAIRADADLNMQLVATGMHLEPQFGLTYRVIEADGFKIDRKVKILRYGNTDVGVTKAFGLGCQKFAEVFSELKPDMVVLIGDRYETFAACVAAYFQRIPIAHIHGGETTQGAFDEGIRHSISKMATVHFAAADAYAQRIIQLGESPKRVFPFGAPGLDTIYRTVPLSREELEARLGLKLTAPVAVVTYHPVTLESADSQKQADELFAALKRFSLTVIFTKANADPQGVRINTAADRFCKQNPKRYKLFDNLGQRMYYSCLKNADLMIGNSSSGLLEAPVFHLPAVNIGDRQKNRIRSANVIDVDCRAEAIAKGIRRALSAGFRRSLKKLINPYDRTSGRVGERIKNQLKRLSLHEGVIKKTFFDLPVKVGGNGRP